MADNSDYTKSRLDLTKYLEGTTFDTPVNQSLIENTYNRFLTKDETIETIGTIGLRDQDALVDRQLAEDTIHRQTYQLQPIIHDKVATVDYTMSFKDVLSDLDRLGVDVNRLDKWADTEQFNFAPPVDMDKLTNYRDYYWYDADSTGTRPQYIVIKNPCTIVTNRLLQRQKDVSRAGVMSIVGVNLVTNEFEITNDVEVLFPTGTLFDIVGGTVLDGQYTVTQARRASDITYIKAAEPISSVLYNGARITFDSQIAQLTADRNRVCDAGSGWDVGVWDDSEPLVAGALSPIDPVQLQFVKDNSTSVYELIVTAHPEYLDSGGNIIVPGARPLWQWMDSDKPEFDMFWDGQGIPTERNMWQIDNKWVHKLDMLPGAISKSSRAEAPILEYLPNLQMNEWSMVHHKWMYRSDPVTGTFKNVDYTPTVADYNDPQFLNKWIYVGTDPTTPVTVQEQNPNASLMSTDLASSSILETYRSFSIVSMNYALSQIVVTGTPSVPGGTAVKVSTSTSILDKVTTAPPSVLNGATTLTLNDLTGLEPGQLLLTKSTSVFDVVLFPDYKRVTALAGTNAPRVYLDEVQMTGSYGELPIVDFGGAYYVAGITFDEAISTEQRIEVGIDPAAASDVGKLVWIVRSVKYIKDADWLEAGTPAKFINASSYFRMRQSKRLGEQKIPLFDLFHPNGETAYAANPVFFYQIDQSARVNRNLQLRIKTRTETGRVFYFDQLLIEYDNGPTLCYKDNDSINMTNPNGLQTIWRTDLANRYVPRFVDVNRHADGDIFYDAQGNEQVAEVNSDNGDWEIINQHVFNAAHENKKYIDTVDLTEHIKTMVQAQDTVPGFIPSIYGFRLLEDFNYGIGGTIKEHNGSYDTLASAMFVTGSTPLSVISYAETAYDTALGSLKDYIIANASSFLTNKTYKYLMQLNAQVIIEAIAAYEANDNNDVVFGDSNTFVNGKGVKNWPATIPFVGMGQLFKPARVNDEALGIHQIKHHDGHYDTYTISPADQIGVARRTIRGQYTIEINSQEVTRFYGWTTTQAADNGPNVTSYSDITVSRIQPGDMWVDGQVFKRFQVIEIGNDAPSFAVPAGSIWLRKADVQLMVIQTVGSISQWVPMPGSPSGSIEAAWVDISLSDVLNDVVFEVESRLYAAALESNIEITTPQSLYVRDSLDVPLYEELREHSFDKFARARQINVPYASVYKSNDPFSWNYSGVQANLTIAGVYQNVWNPNNDGTDIDWAGYWAGIYLNVYGTSYPHREPWVLQGFASKPEWWDEWYVDSTGNRVWTIGMWTNVLSNRIPAQFDAPAPVLYTEVDLSTGVDYKIMEKRFTYVPVNISREVTNTSNVVLYKLDDLFPPYDSRLLDPINADIVTGNSIGKPMIRRPEALDNVNLRQPFSFGDGSPIEQEWLNSTDVLYGELETAFRMQPIRFIDNAWGTKFVSVGSLKINAETNRVFSHWDTIFHGDVVDGKVYKSIGLNQWYVNYNRDSGLDFKVSNFRELWTDWTMHLAYQFGCYINTRSLDVSSTSYDMIRQDFSIISKKSPGFDSCQVDSLQVTVANYGEYRVSGGLKIPLGDGYSWSFLIDVPSSVTSIDYYGVAKYQYTVIDKDSGLLEIVDGQLPWVDGDQVYLYSTQYAPYPMDVSWAYYVSTVDGNPKQFRVSRNKQDAMNKTGTMLRTEGTGVQFIGQINSTFVAQNGRITPTAWKHNAIDKQQLHTVTLPYVVQGIQGLIDFVDGYAARLQDQGIRVNDSQAREIDPMTGRLVSWQTEIERCISKVFTGIGKSNTSIKQYGNTYKYTVRDPNENPDVFELSSVSVLPFQLAEEVYVFTEGSTPPGITLNVPYYVIPTTTTSFQLATTPENAYDGISINVTGAGVGEQYVGVFPSSFMAGDEYVEINPFRNHVWISTPSGVVANVFTGGSQDTTETASVYDQYGRPLPKGSLTVLREDLITRLSVRPGMQNDVLVAAESDSYNFIHIGGVKFYVDGYEHIVMFNDYTTEGYLIYDPFVGMDVSRLTVRFSRSATKTLRPNIGGYFYHNGEMIRNLEASVSDMRSYYDSHGGSAVSEYVDYSRGLLGYEDPLYLDHLNIPERSKFLFWKGMIQSKGSKNAINAFINSKHFVDAHVDEFWAYKVSDFGDIRQKYKPEINIRVSDSYTSDLRYEFAPVGGSVSSRFVGISYADETRWVNPMEVKVQMKNNPLYFDAERVSLTLPVQIHSTGKYIILPTRLDDIHAEYVNSLGQLIRLNVGTELVKVNDRTYRLATVITSTTLKVIGYVPAASKLDPIHIIDKSSDVTIAASKVWDPLNGHQYYAALKDVTYWIGTDPANYGDGVAWTSEQVGTKWVDTSTLSYVPYDDTTVFPEFNDRMARWGRLAQWAKPAVYEWVRSTMTPEEFLEAVPAQEGDSSLVVTNRASGMPITVIKRESDNTEIRLVPVTTIFDVADQLAIMKSNPMYLGLDVHVYVNGTFKVQRTLEEASMADISYTIGDYVVLLPALPVGEAGFTTDYRYLEVIEADTQGNDMTVYYFWAQSRNVAPVGEMTAAQIASKLAAPDDAYHMYRKYEPASGTLPNRYVQVVLRNVAQLVNDDNRYIAQFTRDFTLRDTLDAGRSALDLKNKHTEWQLFREKQPYKVSPLLWDRMSEALIGFEIAGFDQGTRAPVPSLTYAVFDQKNNTTTRFGMEQGQAFVERDLGLSTIQSLLQDPTFDTAPIDKYVFLETYTFDTPVNIRRSLQYIFANFSNESVNRLFFEVMYDALSNKKDFAGLFMTSFIALHGIKILETSGSVV